MRRAYNRCGLWSCCYSLPLGPLLAALALLASGRKPFAALLVSMTIIAFLRGSRMQHGGPYAEATRLGVPDDLRSCHTATVGRYALEGHVPAEDIARLLREKPVAAGLTVAGMPAGAPGMEHGGNKQPYHTILFDRTGQTRVFASH